MNYYIHNDEFITTDIELTENIGQQSLSDYKNGKYIKLNEAQIQYMNDNPQASPLEVFLMSRIGPKLSVLENQMYQWYYDNVEKVIINGRTYEIFDWRSLLQEARVYLELGRETMTFTIWGHRFQGTTQQVYQFLLQFGAFCCDLGRIRETHFNYVEAHPDEENYDYTVGVPQVISVNFEEV